MLYSISSDQPILVIGGGIAGISVAIFLKKAGIACRVFEAHRDLTNIGGGLQIFPNGMRILAELGLEKKAIASGALMTEAQFKDHQGKPIVRSSMGIASRYGLPTITIRRSVLHKLLIDEGEKQGIFVEYEKKLCHIEEKRNQVNATFEDGAIASGRLLIGADGIHSFVRKYILPECPDALYSNLIGFSGFIPGRDLDPCFHPGTLMEITVGPIGFFGYSYADNLNTTEPHLLWYCYLAQKNKLKKDTLAAMTEDEMKQRVLDAHKGWRQPIEALVRQTSKIFRISLSDIMGLEKWHKGRVGIMGDAAHAMNPISGQGACVSLEDAKLFSKLFKKNQDRYVEVFSRFEAERKLRVDKITAKARKSSLRTMIPMGRFGCWLRNRIFAIAVRLTAQRWNDWVFKYEIEQ